MAEGTEARLGAGMDALLGAIERSQGELVKNQYEATLGLLAGMKIFFPAGKDLNSGVDMLMSLVMTGPRLDTQVIAQMISTAESDALARYAIEAAKAGG